MLVTCRRCAAPLHAGGGGAMHPLCSDCRGSAEDPHRASFHPLSAPEIERAVEWTAPGTYVLGYLDGSDFTVFYVGRSDTDVGSTLIDWVGAGSVPPRRRRAAGLPWQAQAGARWGAPARGCMPAHADTGYTHFAFHYAASPIDAFERECRAYHALGGSSALDNRRHPEPPAGLSWACPVHGI
jgi:hypothetical protein